MNEITTEQAVEALKEEILTYEYNLNRTPSSEYLGSASKDIFESKIEVRTKAIKALEHCETLLSLLADTIPDDPNEFNSETGCGEPQHWMTLPYDRSLEIVYEETGDDNRYYSWRIHCNDQEFDRDDYHSTMGVMGETVSDTLSFDTRLSMINWAIKVASEKPAA